MGGAKGEEVALHKPAAGTGTGSGAGAGGWGRRPAHGQARVCGEVGEEEVPACSHPRPHSVRRLPCRPVRATLDHSRGWVIDPLAMPSCASH